MLEGRVARAYEAMSRKDLDAVMRGWAEDGVWEYPGNTPMSGRIVGKPAIAAWFRRWFDQVASARFTIRQAALANPVALTWANTLMVEWEAEITTADGRAFRGPGVEVWQRRGKCVHARLYLFDTVVLEALWGRRETATAA